MTITAQVPGPRKREETTISTRFCRALGACVLTTGLAFGGAGGAIASADDAGDTAASTTSDTSGPDTSSPDTATAGTPSLRQSVQNAVHDLTADGTAGLNPQQDRVAQAADDPADKDAADSAAADTPDDAADAPSGTTTGDAEAESTAPGAGQDARPTTSTASATSAADPVTPGDGVAEQPATETAVAAGNSSTPAASHSDPVVTPSHPATPADTPAAAVTANPKLTKLLQPAAVVVSSATNLVVTVGDAVVAVPALIASLPSSTTPVADVIAFLLTTATSVGESILPLASLPADLAAALIALSVTGATPAAAHPDSGIHAPGFVSLDAPRPAVAPATSGAASDSALRNPVTFAARGGFAAPVALAAATRPAAAPVAAPAPAPHSMMPYITGALAALLISASLWALFAAALPGLGGLAAFGATGVRIGYRQAKAGTALYRTDLARFAPRGPIGVVRSDALVSVHRRSADRFRADERPATRHLRLVDTAA